MGGRWPVAPEVSALPADLKACRSADPRLWGGRRGPAGTGWMGRIADFLRHPRKCLRFRMRFIANSLTLFLPGASFDSNTDKSCCFESRLVQEAWSRWAAAQEILCGADDWKGRPGRWERAMSETTSGSNFIGLTAEIVSAYVSNNSVSAGDLPALINQ